jgi:hypothetical protein
MDAKRVDARLAERRIAHRQFYNGAMHEAMLAIPEYVRPLIA